MSRKNLHVPSIFPCYLRKKTPKKYPRCSHDCPKKKKKTIFPAKFQKKNANQTFAHPSSPSIISGVCGFGFLPGHGPKDLVVQGLGVPLGAVIVRRPAQREGSTQAAVDQHGVARLGRSGTLGHGDLQRGMLAILKEICIDYMCIYI